MAKHWKQSVHFICSRPPVLFTLFRHALMAGMALRRAEEHLSQTHRSIEAFLALLIN